MNPYDIGPILRRMTGAVPGASDILFSSPHKPHLIVDGELVPAPLKDLRKLTPYQTEVLALSLLRDRPAQMAAFGATGSVSFSMTLRKVGHFRVTVFKQRNEVALVFRVIPLHPPTIDSLGLPKSLAAISELRRGLVVFSSAAGCGKTTTLAAVVQQLNRAYPYHMITVEKPVEFVFTPERALIHQREIGYDTRDFPTAIEAARRQSPRVLIVSEVSDSATAEAVLAAVEAGLLVLVTVEAESAFTALHALLRHAPPQAPERFRHRLASSLQFLASQRLLLRENARGRIAAMEILKTNPTVRDFIAKGAPSAGELTDILRAGEAQGMQSMETDVARVVQAGFVSRAAATATEAAPLSAPGVHRELDMADDQVLDLNLTT